MHKGRALAKPGLRVVVALVIAAIGIALDQYTKWVALQHLAPYDPRPVFPGLNWTLAFNRGAAFSLMSTDHPWVQGFFSVFPFVVVVGLMIWLYHLTWPQERLNFWGIAFVCSGAIGNVIDRFRIGAVVDFIDVYAGRYHWPVFNIADSLICLGVGCLLWASLRGER